MKIRYNCNPRDLILVSKNEFFQGFLKTIRGEDDFRNADVDVSFRQHPSGVVAITDTQYSPDEYDECVSLIEAIGQEVLMPKNVRDAIADVAKEYR